VSGRWRARLQVAAVLALIVAYAGLSHYGNTVAGARGLGTALALAPLLAIGLLLLWRGTRPLIALALAALAAALLHVYWPLLEKKFYWMCLLQECGLYGLLAISFARSLRPGATALCTQLADKLHGPLTPREVRYTRRVTAAWALFLAAIVAVTFALFVAAPLRVWSLFANFFTLPLVALMFVAEYAVRARVLPQTERRGILATLRTFLASSP
jgi:uncharacterized membrane protein